MKTLLKTDHLKIAIAAVFIVFCHSKAKCQWQVGFPFLLHGNDTARRVYADNLSNPPQLVVLGNWYGESEVAFARINDAHGTFRKLPYRNCADHYTSVYQQKYTSRPYSVFAYNPSAGNVDYVISGILNNVYGVVYTLISTTLDFDNSIGPYSFEYQISNPGMVLLKNELVPEFSSPGTLSHNAIIGNGNILTTSSYTGLYVGKYMPGSPSTMSGEYDLGFNFQFRRAIEISGNSGKYYILGHSELIYIDNSSLANCWAMQYHSTGSTGPGFDLQDITYNSTSNVLAITGTYATTNSNELVVFEIDPATGTPIGLKSGYYYYNSSSSVYENIDGTSIKFSSPDNTYVVTTNHTNLPGNTHVKAGQLSKIKLSTIGYGSITTKEYSGSTDNSLVDCALDASNYVMASGTGLIPNIRLYPTQHSISLLGIWTDLSLSTISACDASIALTPQSVSVSASPITGFVQKSTISDASILDIGDAGLCFKTCMTSGAEYLCGCQVIADFTAPTDICPGTTVTLTNTSLLARYYHWDVYEGNTLIYSATTRDLTFLFADAGSYTIILKASSDYCSKEKSVTITVGPKAATNITITPTTTAGQFSFSFTPPTSATITYSYSWNFGDGSSASTTGSPINHTYSTAGRYKVCLTISSTCGTNTLCQYLCTQTNPLHAAFTPNNTVFCKGQSATFTNSSISASTVTWLYDRVVAGSSNTYTVTFNDVGDHVIKLAARDDCNKMYEYDTASLVVHVFDKPSAQFTYTYNSTSVTFNPSNDPNCNSSLPACTYYWEFKDDAGVIFSTSTHQNPTLTISSLASRQFIACLTVSNQSGTSGCGAATVCKNICLSDGEIDCCHCHSGGTR